MTAVYAWRVRRGESAGLLCPVEDAEGDRIDVTDGADWPTTARVHPEPGDDRVLHEFTGASLVLTSEGVHLHLTAEETRAASWRRGWLEVICTDPRAPREVAVIVRGPLTIEA